MHRKGSPIALIRAADHLGRQGSQSEPPFVPPLKPAAAHTATKLAAPRITGAPRTGHPDFTIRTPISPSGPQFHHPNSTSHLPPPPERGGAGRNLPGLAAPSAARPRARRAAGLPTGRARPRAVPRPRSAARIHGDAARGARARRGHEVAPSARECRRRRELSKVKVTNRLFFFPSRSRFRAFPVLSSPRTHPPSRGRPRVSGAWQPRCHFPARAAALRWYHPPLPPPGPSPSAKPLLNVTKTFRGRLDTRHACSQINTVQEKKNPHIHIYTYVSIYVCVYTYIYAYLYTYKIHKER